MGKLLLDLDRTLFDTATFVDTIWPWIGKTYGIDAQAARASQQTYFRYVGDMYDYDFFTHIQTLGIDKTDLMQRARFELRDPFIFADVEAFLERTQDLDRAILTFGNEPYQSFKLSFCPQLLDLPVYSTLIPKSQYIAEHWPDMPVILVDDKNLSGSLPGTVKFIHLDRAQQLPTVEHNGYVSVRTLTDIKKEWLI